MNSEISNSPNILSNKHDASTSKLVCIIIVQITKLLLVHVAMFISATSQTACYTDDLNLLDYIDTYYQLLTVVVMKMF